MKARDFASFQGRSEDGYDSYQAEPSVFYPATIQFIKKTIAEGGALPSYLQQPMMIAQAVPADGWALAERTAEGLTDEQRNARAQALEAARLVFTALLREQNGGAIHLHIVKHSPQDAMYKL